MALIGAWFAGAAGEPLCSKAFILAMHEAGLGRSATVAQSLDASGAASEATVM